MEEIFRDKVILITGGTGFIGKALIKKILKENPHSIRLFSRDEVKHHKIQEEFKELAQPGGGKIRNFVGDIRDYERVKKATIGCDIVIHAAAMKRIDMIEYNIEESIKTNILGTLNVAKACLENNVEKAIYISTDKACSPINTYGACKFLGEKIFSESNFNKGKSKTIFGCVRYGNVLESTGSIIPIILNKIAKNEPITLTDTRMTRFFITSEQSIELIVNAIKFSVGGEIFVPKLNSFKIEDLINIIKEHYGDFNETIITGIRPGEKIHELMIQEYEASRTYDLGEMYVIDSEIKKYQKHVMDYIVPKKLVEFKEYSSKDFIIQKDEIRKKLKEYGILK